MAGGMGDSRGFHPLLQSNTSPGFSGCLTAAALVLVRMTKDVWHNQSNVFGGGHLKRLIYRSPAAAFFSP